MALPRNFAGEARFQSGIEDRLRRREKPNWGPLTLHVIASTRKWGGNLQGPPLLPPRVWVGHRCTDLGPNRHLSRRMAERVSGSAMLFMVQPHQEIAASLYISSPTVKKHLEHAYEKLGVNSRAQAVVHIMEHSDRVDE